MLSFTCYFNCHVMLSYSIKHVLSFCILQLATFMLLHSIGGTCGVICNACVFRALF